MYQKTAVAFGGGHGLQVTAQALVKAGYRVVAGVTSYDYGGSAGDGRRTFPGGFAESDLINVMEAISGNNREEILHILLKFRFPKGSLYENMRASTFIFHALSSHYGSFSKAYEKLHEALDLEPHKVLPITIDDAHLKAVYKDDTGEVVDVIVGEDQIDAAVAVRNAGIHIDRIELVDIKRNNVYVQPHSDLIDEINKTDVVVIGPGSYYTSILPNLITPGVVEAIDQCNADILLVMNLTTVWGDTHGMDVDKHYQVINSHLGDRKVTHCIVNKSNKDYPIRLIRNYGNEKAEILSGNFAKLSNSGVKVKSTPVYDQSVHKTYSGSLRHDPQLLAEAIVNVLNL